MQPKQRRQAIQALQDAADSLMKSAGPRKRRNKKPRGTPDFKTTDEMLEYAMRHKGERDVPAPGIRYRGTTSDSEIPDTFGRVWASTVSARDLGRIDPKKFYVVIPFSDEYGKKEMADLSNGVLDGVLGISEKHQIIMQWYGIVRDAILVMDADKLTKVNKLSRVQYDNPEYLVSNGMAALYRIFDKKRDSGGGRGLAGNLIDHMLIGIKTGKKPGGDILSEAKDLAGSIEKHAEALRRSLKALPFDKYDLRQAVESVTGRRMDESDIEDFAGFSGRAVKNLTEFSTSYDGLSAQLIKLYLDNDYDMEPSERTREAAALAPKAEAAALDYGRDATQTEALMKVMNDLATLVQDFDAIKALSKKANDEVASFSSDYAISNALGYDRGRALEKSFGDSGTDDIKTVKGLAKRVADVFKDGGYNYNDITLPAWERAIRKALKSIGSTFNDEGEWLVKDKKLKIPSGSTLFVTSDHKLPPDVEERRQAGTLTGLDEMVHGHEIKYAGQYDKMIKKYDLDKRYKVQRIDKEKFDKARSIYLTAPKKVAASISDWRGEWIHFSKLPVLKINPKQFHSDPAGLYFFPEKFDPAGSWTKYDYKFTAELAPSAKVLDLSDLNWESAIALVRKVTGEEPKQPENFTGTPTSKWDNGTPGSRAWEAMREHFTRRPGAFNKALQRAGYDAVFDDTKAIHFAEVQLLVLNEKVVKVLNLEDLKKGSGFAAVEQASGDLAKALETFGKVTKTPPRKGKGDWGGAPVLQSVVEVKTVGKSASFMVKADMERGTVNVSMRWSEPRLNYGVGAEFDIYRKRWDGDQFDRLLRSVQTVFEEPKAVAAKALLAAHKAVAEALALVSKVAR